MDIRIVSDLTAMVDMLAAELRELGHTVNHRPTRAMSTELRHRPECTDLSEIQAKLRPLTVHQNDYDTLDVDVEILIGNRKGLSDWSVSIYSDAPELADRMRRRAIDLGFSFSSVSDDEQESNKLVYGGASEYARQVVRWFLLREGITPAEDKSWGDSDNDLWIYMRNPLYDMGDLRGLVDVQVVTDDPANTEAVAAPFADRGFSKVNVGFDAGGGERFELNPGAFKKDESSMEAMMTAARGLMEAHGVDTERYPLVKADASGRDAVITLPFKSVERGLLRPYSGSFPERWDVVVRTDSQTRAAPFVERLQAEGYRVAFEAPEGALLGFSARWGAAADHYSVVATMTEALNAIHAELEASESYEVSTSKSLPDDDGRILIDLPTEHLTDEAFLHRLKSACGRYDFSLRAPDPSAYEAARAALAGLEFSAFHMRTDSDYSSRELRYGGAPPAVVELLADMLAPHIGGRPTTSKAWSDSDNDIWLCLPPFDGAAVVVDEHASEVSLAGWFGDLEEAERPFLEVEEQRVRIGHVVLPRGDGDGAMVPRAASFEHYCLDQRTAITLAHVAESVALGEPCLLEGETSVSKTSVIQYLAHLCRRPLVRLNLNGQTDTGELVGRYLPQSGSEMPVAPEELLAASELLEEESRFILERCRDEGRDLTEVEVQQIMANERMTVHPWRWHDGLVLAAMRNGWWLVLDELNLAEPQILERLNSVLEREPTLVLTEHDNTVFGPGGVAVHRDFRIFATMNPAEYAGRSALSPAYRDRWRGYRFVDAPTEAEYRAMLNFSVFGEEPEVQVLGEAFTGRTLSAPYGQLAGIEHIDRFLAALARFHAALEGAAGVRGGVARLGARRRERHVFTRRGLLAVLDYLRSAVAGGDPVRAMRVAIHRYYLARIADPSDRALVVDLLDAAGIGPNTWQLVPPEHTFTEEQRASVRMILSALDGDAISDAGIAGLMEELDLTEDAVRALVDEEA